MKNINLRSPITNVVSVALLAWRPVFVALMGAVSFQKLDCGAPSSKRRHNGAVSPVRWRFLRERMSCRHSGLTITASSFARRFYRPQTLHDHLLLRRDKLWRGANATHKLRGRAEIHLEKPSGREKTAIKCDMSSGAKTAPRASRFVWPARSS